MTNKIIDESSGKAVKEKATIRDRLVGAWQLLSYVSTPDDPTKEVTYPLGKDPKGILLYTADGYMSAQVQALDSAKEELDANSTQLTGYLGYAGPFYLDETGSEPVLQHHMSLSSFPAWLGDTQRRLVCLEGNILVLSTELGIVVEGQTHRPTLTWRRTKNIQESKATV